MTTKGKLRQKFHIHILLEDFIVSMAETIVDELMGEYDECILYDASDLEITGSYETDFTKVKDHSLAYEEIKRDYLYDKDVMKIIKKHIDEIAEKIQVKHIYEYREDMEILEEWED